MSKAYIIAAKRSAVVPRNGAFSDLELHDLAAPVVQDLLSSAKIKPEQVDALLMGNALYGGGNPARMVALAAGLPEIMPAFSLDTQCCSGMDSIALAAQRITAGQDSIIIAGGAESYSRSPKRFKRASSSQSEDEEYLRPPFSPWADRDPDMLVSAAQLAKKHGIPREAQEAFAIESHGKSNPASGEITAINDISTDKFTRKLSTRACSKLPVIEGDIEHGLTSATTAVEADAAAFTLLVNEEMLKNIAPDEAFEIIATQSIGGDPSYPAIAPISSTEKLFERTKLAPENIDVFEVMEAFAVQAMLFQNHFNIAPDKLNLGGGALSRGHPISASGSINIVRLCYELSRREKGAKGLATIAAAGGLGSSILLEKQ